MAETVMAGLPGRGLLAINLGLFFRLALLLVALGAAPSASAEEWIYTARPGDNLWDLSATYLKDVSDYRRLQRHNHIKAPKRIPPGTQLRIPIAWLKHAPASVQVVHVRGHAEFVRGSDAQAHPLSPGDALAIGDRVRVDPDGNATLRFADGSTLVLQAGSELTLDTLTAYGKTGMVDTRLRLQHGRVETKVRPLRGPASRYEVITPAAVTAVRGTDFRISANRDRPVSRSEALSGEVGITGAGVTQVLPAGFGTLAEAGKPPLSPRPLLPPPDISSLSARVNRLPVRLSWPPLDGATAYRAQVAPDAAFATLLIDRVLTKPDFQLSDLADGQYVVRLRAIDDIGLEGLNADHRLIVKSPLQPVLESPVVDKNQARFQWQGGTDAHRYQFQIARDAEFEELIDERTVAESQLTLENLKPGTYYCRVSAVEPGGFVGPFSVSQRIEIAPRTHWPVLIFSIFPFLLLVVPFVW